MGYYSLAANSVLKDKEQVNHKIEDSYHCFNIECYLAYLNRIIHEGDKRDPIEAPSRFCRRFLDK